MKPKAPTEPSYFTPEPVDNRRLAHLCGPLDENLRQISAALDVTIFRRGERFVVTGQHAERGAALLEKFYDRAERPISIDDVQLALVEDRARFNRATSQPPSTGLANVSSSSSVPQASLPSRSPIAAVERRAPAGHAKSALTPPVLDDEEQGPLLKTRRAGLRGRTPHQLAYLRAILDNDISFGIGPAGTGKTFLAVACAVDAIERDAVQRIILTRPAVEAGERLGFLPGDLSQKVDPYLRPLYDALYDLMGFDKVQKLFEKQILEVAPLAYMRGRTLNNAFIILDEAQNTTPEQMKMFLTRIGFGSKAVVTGDATQIDLQKGQKSGLIDAMHVLQDIRGIAFCHFDSSDVLRHPLVGRIVDAYADASDNHQTNAPVTRAHNTARETGHDTGITRARSPRRSS